MDSHRGSPDLALVLESMASPIRLRILKSLAVRKLSYTELVKAVGLDRDRDAGKFSYHLKKLITCGLVEVDSSTGKYTLSSRGAKILSALESIEEELRDKGRMIVRRSNQIVEPFDKNKIVEALVREGKLPPKLASEIASMAERKLLDLRIEYLSAPLIRELVNAILLDMGLEKYRHRLTRIGMPLHDAETLFKKSIESGDWMLLAQETSGAIMREYLLLGFLPRNISDMHLSGKIDIYPVSGWLTCLFSRAVKLDSGELTRSAMELCASFFHVRHEIRLLGPEPSIRSIISSLPDNMPKRRIISIEGTSDIIKLLQEIPRDVRPSIGVMLDCGRHDIRDIALASKMLRKLGIPHTYSLSAEAYFTGLRLEENCRAIHSIISLNVLRAAMDSDGDLDGLLANLRNWLKGILPIIRRGLMLAEKLHAGSRPYSMIALSGLIEAGKFLARGRSTTIEEAVELELAVLRELSKLIPQTGDVMLAGRCPISASRRFFHLDSQRYDEELLRNLTHGAKAYSVSPIPRLSEYKSMESWIESARQIVQHLNGGFCLWMDLSRSWKALSEAIYAAEELRKYNKHGVIAAS
ncbi:MAG: ArsR family transcriptional regulator [Aigarchaeota archaeon]|nr:ArsR family transcriptional regulator [Candidatus Wolframiiraptor gerlachensis]